MADPPTGTVTFLFTDIEGSTRLWEAHPEGMRDALTRHDALLTESVQQYGGKVIKSRGEGDSFFAVFACVTDAVAAATGLQQALCAEPWPAEIPLRVRVALHTGEAEQREGDYYGSVVNRCARLRAVAHGGQVLLSQATADLLQGALSEDLTLLDLGVHRLKDLQQPEHLFQIVHPTLPADFPPPPSLEAFAHNLPRQLTSFIGRETEIAAVKQLLSNTCLLTLTGAGGCGKTRLALQVAGDLLEEFTDGVWLVELAALTDPTLVLQRVAAALGVREQPGRTFTQALLDFLRFRRALLLLDNCEHLLSAAAQLADTLLRACPQLRVLATSREGLGIGGETRYRVPSLSLPDPRRRSPLAELSRFEAVSLFVDRAAAALPSFALNERNGPVIAQVCHRLDGIPLAIELASARVKLLPVEKLAARLNDRFRLLTGGSRTALPRQQTLRATIDWSYELLSEPERALLHRLSVFSGGWSLEAAEAVTCGEAEGACAGEGIAAEEILELLGRLVDKSLVQVAEQEGEARYHMLETIRQYGVEKLWDLGEEGAWRDRHRDWFLALAEEAEPELRGPAQQEWLSRLAEEHENLRGALSWCVQQGEGEVGLRLAGALGSFWSIRGLLTEGRERLAAVLALPGTEARTAAWAKALNVAGGLAASQGEYKAAHALLAESLAVSRERDDPRGIASSLLGLGCVARTQGDRATAQALLEQSLAISRQVGDPYGIADSLGSLGYLARLRGEYETARALMEQSLVIGRQTGDQQSIAASLSVLGLVANLQGNGAAAQALAEESLAIYRQLGDQESIPFCLYILGAASCRQGDYQKARECYEEGLAISRAVGHPTRIIDFLGALGHLERDAGDYARCAAYYRESLAHRQLIDIPFSVPQGLEDFVGLAGRQEQWERAVRLLGAVQEAARRIGRTPPLSALEEEYYRTVDGARTALGEEGFAAAWAAGEALSLEEAVAFAVEESPEG